MLGELVRHRCDRIVALGLAKAGLARRRIALAPGVQGGVGLAHEGMEVHAPLAGHRRGLEEEVHDHRLAAPDRPVEIDAPRRLPTAVQERQAEAGLRQRVQLAFQARQGRDRSRLGHVGRDFAGRQAGLVGASDGFGHGRLRIAQGRGMSTAAARPRMRRPLRAL